MFYGPSDVVAGIMHNFFRRPSKHTPAPLPITLLHTVFDTELNTLLMTFTFEKLVHKP
jgi:hypothetical protein